MQRRLNIAAGLLHRPRLLILDEPTVGIDPQSRNAILEAVAALGESGMSVLYTTHYMEEAERLCRRVGHRRPRPSCWPAAPGASWWPWSTSTTRWSITVAGDAAARPARSGGRPGGPHRRPPPTTGRSPAWSPRRRPACRQPDHAPGRGGRGMIRDVKIAEPSLDSVFLHITGTALRD